MNASNGSAAPQPLLPLNNLIKPEDVQRIPNFTDDTRSKYFEGVSKLWATIKGLPQEHEAHQGAHKKLSDVTNQIRAHLRKSAAQTNTGGAVPTTQGPMAQDARPASQQPVLANGQLQISQKVAQAAMSLSLVVPPNYAAQGPDTIQQWIKEAKQKYAQQLQRYETYNAQLNEIAQLIETRRKEGKAFTDQEKQELSRRKINAEGMRNQAREYIMKFKQQQEQYKSAVLGTNGSAPPPDGSVNHVQGSSMENVETKPMSVEPQLRQQPEHQGQAHTISSALDAARQQANAIDRNATSPTNAQSNQPSAGQAPGLQNQQIKKEPSTSQHPLNINIDGMQRDSQNNSPRVGQHPAAPSQGPHPLSHQAAMANVQKYQLQNFQQQATPSSTTHAHPPIPNRSDTQSNNNVKFPIPKELKVGAPQPVTMGPARPTLTGGPSNGAPGQMGLPAIPRHPGYVLEGEGDRVLSKKRLQQLMREVTGASEGDDAEVMAPDVEEVRNHSLFPASSSNHFSLPFPTIQDFDNAL